MIREAVIGDINALAELARFFVPKVGAATLSESRFRPAMNQLIKSDNALILVAEHEGEIVGAFVGQVMRVWYSDDYYATDLAFVVQPKYAGLYGWLMAKRFIRWAKAMPKVVDVTLQVSSGMDAEGRIGKMYESLGLAHVGGCYTLKVERKK
jgi:hypothetical protein